MTTTTRLAAHTAAATAAAPYLDALEPLADAATRLEAWARPGALRVALYAAATATLEHRRACADALDALDGRDAEPSAAERAAAADTYAAAWRFRFTLDALACAILEGRTTGGRTLTTADRPYLERAAAIGEALGFPAALGILALDALDALEAVAA